MHTRPTYLLQLDGTTLLALDAAITPPFVTGELVTLHPPLPQPPRGPFIVTTITRALPYHMTATPPVTTIALAGQEVYVHLRAWPKEEAPHAAP